MTLPVAGQDKLKNLLGDGFSFGRPGGGVSSGITVSATLEAVDAATADLHVTVQLPHHHYIYSATTPFGLPAKISINAPADIERVGNMRSDRPPEVVHDKSINETMEKFYDKVTWSQRIQSKTGQLTAGLTITGELTGQYCSDQTCVEIRPPEKFSATLGDIPAATATPTRSAADTTRSVGPTAEVVPSSTGDRPSPIRYSVSLTPENPVPGRDVVLTVRATIDQPYHTYSITQNPDVLGTSPTEIILESVTGAQPIDKMKSLQQPERKPGPAAGEVIEVHHDMVEWKQTFTATSAHVAIGGLIVYQVCDPVQCLPVGDVKFSVAAGQPSAGEEVAVVAAGHGSESTGADGASGPTGENSEFGSSADESGLLAFLFSAVSAGFLALLTPCVFPMIPVTVAYFLKQGSDRPGSTVKLALIYCFGIISAFTVLGLAMAVLVGPTALNELANNPWLNLAFAVIFTVFALMLMGMFEVQVPSWLLTWSAKNQEAGGVVGVLFMALTFTLVSFTCTFAFVGSLLVWAARGSFLMPILGMIAFSSAFASPFFLLALFPGFLKKLPKSGGWMNTVKVTLGLLELAIVTKFLSVADTGLSSDGTPVFLDYHLVMASWIAVALVTGMYLLGRFRMPHDTPTDTIGPVRCVVALGFMGLAAYISFGVFSPKPPEGTLWQQIAAFAAPQIEISADSGQYYTEHHGLKYALDFDKAVVTASGTNQPMFLDVTGMNCINCRLMEKTVLASESVTDLLSDLVRVQLYTDIVPGVKSNPEEHDRLLARNRELQEKSFGDVALPTYFIVTPDGKEVLSMFQGLDRTNGRDFQQFLKAGLQRWEQKKSETAGSAVSPSGGRAVHSASYQVE